jgi:hypothetical protein
MPLSSYVKELLDETNYTIIKKKGTSICFRNAMIEEKEFTLFFCPRIVSYGKLKNPQGTLGCLRLVKDGTENHVRKTYHTVISCYSPNFSKLSNAIVLGEDRSVDILWFNTVLEILKLFPRTQAELNGMLDSDAYIGGFSVRRLNWLDANGKTNWANAQVGD